MNFFIFIFLSLFLVKAHAYPDFIGYGYRNCLACHVSGPGGGALTDYGRSVFAVKVAANPFSKWADDEALSEYSNFLFKKNLPKWLRLGYKYRYLNVEKDPGSATSSKSYYTMQNDLNVNLFLDQADKYSLISTLGYIENPNMVLPNKTMSPQSYLFWREYYLRVQLSRAWWVYTGFMDKAFGIRHPDHTAVNRARIGLGQNDQVHSVLLQYSQKDQDIYVQGWIGNAHLPQDQRKSGGSLFYEKGLAEKIAAGASLLTEKSESSKRTQYSTHAKFGIGDGNSFLLEAGLVDELNDLTSNQSAYVFSQGRISLERGLALESTGEYWKNSTSSASESFRWTLGFLIFPMQRLEVRIAGRQLKNINSNSLEKDQWYYLTQLHLSL